MTGARGRRLGIEATENPAEVLEAAASYLASRPAEHKVTLTLLHERAEHAEPGRYWVVREGVPVVGVGFQSPLDFPLLLTPMPRAAARALAETMAGSGVELPGVGGDAGTAAAFAGQWSESRMIGARPEMGQRLYRLGDLRLPDGVPGRLRVATAGDRPAAEALVAAFLEHIGERGHSPDVLARRIGAGQVWLWDDGEPACIAVHSHPIEGVTRIQTVFTPPELRRRGYAAGCVGYLSQHLVGRGLQCVLYTDLGNPTSNSVYRRLGYEAVMEAVRYRFVVGPLSG